MNKTDLLEIKKLFKYPEASFGTMHYGSVRSSSDEGEKASERIEFAGTGKYLTREDDEQKSFMSLLSKAYSGAATMSPADVNVDGDMKKLLMSYTSDGVAVPFETLVERIADNYDEMNGYSVVAFRGDYDVPIKDSAKIKTGESEEVYSYLALMICPVKADKGGLCPDFNEKNIVKKGITLQLQPPVFGLIYPSFTDRASDVEHAFVCAKTEKERNLVSKLFGSKLEEPVKEQKTQAKPKSLNTFTKEIEELESEEGIPASILKSVKTGDAKAFAESLKEYSSDVSNNNIDEALLDKRNKAAEEEQFVQKLDIKKDKSKITPDHVMERDIDGKKFFIIPKDLLSQDILDKILNL